MKRSNSFCLILTGFMAKKQGKERLNWKEALARMDVNPQHDQEMAKIEKELVSAEGKKVGVLLQAEQNLDALKGVLAGELAGSSEERKKYVLSQEGGGAMNLAENLVQTISRLKNEIQNRIAQAEKNPAVIALDSNKDKIKQWKERLATIEKALDEQNARVEDLKTVAQEAVSEIASSGADSEVFVDDQPVERAPESSSPRQEKTESPEKITADLDAADQELKRVTGSLGAFEAEYRQLIDRLKKDSDSSARTAYARHAQEVQAFIERTDPLFDRVHTLLASGSERVRDKDPQDDEDALYVLGAKVKQMKSRLEGLEPLRFVMKKRFSENAVDPSSAETEVKPAPSAESPSSRTARLSPEEVAEMAVQSTQVKEDDWSLPVASENVPASPSTESPSERTPLIDGDKLNALLEEKSKGNENEPPTLRDEPYSTYEANDPDRNQYDQGYEVDDISVERPAPEKPPANPTLFKGERIKVNRGDTVVLTVGKDRIAGELKDIRSVVRDGKEILAVNLVGQKETIFTETMPEFDMQFLELTFDPRNHSYHAGDTVRYKRPGEDAEVEGLLQEEPRIFVKGGVKKLVFVIAGERQPLEVSVDAPDRLPVVTHEAALEPYPAIEHKSEEFSYTFGQHVVYESDGRWNMGVIQAQPKFDSALKQFVFTVKDMRTGAVKRIVSPEPLATFEPLKEKTVHIAGAEFLATQIKVGPDGKVMYHLLDRKTRREIPDVDIDMVRSLQEAEKLRTEMESKIKAIERRISSLGTKKVRELTITFTDFQQKILDVAEVMSGGEGLLGVLETGAIGKMKQDVARLRTELSAALTELEQAVNEHHREFENYTRRHLVDDLTKKLGEAGINRSALNALLGPAASPSQYVPVFRELFTAVRANNPLDPFVLEVETRFARAQESSDVPLAEDEYANIARTVMQEWSKLSPNPEIKLTTPENDGEYDQLVAQYNELRTAMDDFSPEERSHVQRALEEAEKELGTIDPAKDANNKRVALKLLKAGRALGNLRIEISKVDLARRREDRDANVVVELPSVVIQELLRSRPQEFLALLEALYNQPHSAVSEVDGSSVIQENLEVTQKVRDLFKADVPPSPAMAKILRGYGIRDWAAFKKVWDTTYAKQVGMSLYDMVRSDIIRASREELPQAKSVEKFNGTFKPWKPIESMKEVMKPTAAIVTYESSQEKMRRISDLMMKRNLAYDDDGNPSGLSSDAFDRFSSEFAMVLRQINFERVMDTLGSEEEQDRFLKKAGFTEDDVIHHDGHVFLKREGFKKLKEHDEVAVKDLHRTLEHWTDDEAKEVKEQEVKDFIAASQGYLAKLVDTRQNRPAEWFKSGAEAERVSATQEIIKKTKTLLAGDGGEYVKNPVVRKMLEDLVTGAQKVQIEAAYIKQNREQARGVGLFEKALVRAEHASDEAVAKLPPEQKRVAQGFLKNAMLRYSLAGLLLGMGVGVASDGFVKKRAPGRPRAAATALDVTKTFGTGPQSHPEEIGMSVKDLPASAVSSSRETTPPPAPRPESERQPSSERPATPTEAATTDAQRVERGKSPFETKNLGFALATGLKKSLETIHGSGQLFKESVIRQAFESVMGGASESEKRALIRLLTPTADRAEQTKRTAALAELIKRGLGESYAQRDPLSTAEMENPPQAKLDAMHDYLKTLPSTP